MKTTFFTKPSRILLLFGIMTTVTFLGCKKEPGPKGPKGDTGPKGNANVVSQTVTVSNWTYDGVNLCYSATIIDNSITQNIIDGGLIMVYIYQNNSNIALPVTIYPTSAYSETYSYGYSLFQIIIKIQDSDLTQPVNPGSRTFRVIKVPPALKRINTDLDWLSYQKIKERFYLTN